VDEDGAAEGGQEVLDGAGRAGLRADARHDDGELVAAQARDGPAAGDGEAEAACDLHEELVAGGVPEAVVDGLEAVEVEQRDGGRPRRGRGRDALEEQRAVGQAGQRVGLGEASQLGRALLDDALEVAGEAAVLEEGGQLAHARGHDREDDEDAEDAVRHAALDAVDDREGQGSGERQVGQSAGEQARDPVPVGGDDAGSLARGARGQQQEAPAPRRVDRVAGDPRAGERHDAVDDVADGAADQRRGGESERPAGGAAGARGDEHDDGHEDDVEDRVGEGERLRQRVGTGGPHRLAEGQPPRQGHEPGGDEHPVGEQPEAAGRGPGRERVHEERGDRERHREQVADVRRAGEGHRLPQHHPVPAPGRLAERPGRREAAEQCPARAQPAADPPRREGAGGRGDDRAREVAEVVDDHGRPAAGVEQQHEQVADGAHDHRTHEGRAQPGHAREIDVLGRGLYPAG
jgi:hypothetical protein